MINDAWQDHSCRQCNFSILQGAQKNVEEGGGGGVDSCGGGGVDSCLKAKHKGNHCTSVYRKVLLSIDYNNKSGSRLQILQLSVSEDF